MRRIKSYKYVHLSDEEIEKYDELLHEYIVSCDRDILMEFRVDIDDETCSKRINVCNKYGIISVKSRTLDVYKYIIAEHALTITRTF
jgi:hypothetical protein